MEKLKEQNTFLEKALSSEVKNRDRANSRVCDLEDQMEMEELTIKKIVDEYAKLEQLLAEAVSFVKDIDSWSKAYPEKVFPEPEPDKVRAVCEQLGITLDSLSAMILRRFVFEWGNKAESFLSKPEIKAIQDSHENTVAKSTEKD